MYLLTYIFFITINHWHPFIDILLQQLQSRFSTNKCWPVRALLSLIPSLTVKLGMPSSERAPPWSSGSVLGHRSLSPVFESRRGHIWRLFHLWLRFITVGGCSAHLANHDHLANHHHHHHFPQSNLDHSMTIW